jgi:hypothetical protein
MVVLSLFLGCVSLIFAALGFAWFRGKSLPGTLVCARCGFDALHLADTQRLCPECGVAIDLPGRVRPQRHRRVRLASIATFIALIALCASLTPVALQLSSPSNHPLWWLHFQLKSADATTRANASRELATRDAAGALTAADYTTLAPTLLALQADTNVPWDTVWGRMIESTAARGVLSNTQLQAYLQHGCSFSIKHPKYVAPGGRILVTYIYKFDRTGSVHMDGVAQIPSHQWFNAGPHNAFTNQAANDGSANVRFSGSSTGSSGANGSSHTVTAPLGTHDIVIPITLTLNSPGWPSTTFTITHRSRLTVTDEPGPFAKAAANPLSTQLLQESFDFEHLAGQGGTGLNADKGIALNVGVSRNGVHEVIFVTMMKCESIAQPVAFDILVRPAGDTTAPWTMLTQYAQPNDRTSVRHAIGYMQTPAPPAFWTVDAVDVLFRASGTVADSASMDEYWPGEFILPAVPLDRKPLLLAKGLTPDNWSASPPINAFAEHVQLLTAAHAPTPDQQFITQRIDALLDRQAGGETWTTDDGNIIDEFRRRGLLTDSQNIRYASQIVGPLTLQVRPRIRLTDESQFGLQGAMPAYRCGVNTDMTVVWNVPRVLLNETQLTHTAAPRARYLPTADFHSIATTLQMRPFQASTTLPPGNYTLRIVQPFRVFAGNVPLEAADAYTPLFVGTQDATLPVRLLAPDEPLVEVVDDAIIGAILDSTLHCTSLWTNFRKRADGTPGDYGGITVRVGELPIAVAFDVFVRPTSDADPAQCWYMGQLVLGPGSARLEAACDNMPYRQLPLTGPLPDATRSGLRNQNVELVLVPNPAAGETRNDVARVWSGDGKERIVPVTEVRNLGDYR